MPIVGEWYVILKTSRTLRHIEVLDRVRLIGAPGRGEVSNMQQPAAEVGTLPYRHRGEEAGSDRTRHGSGASWRCAPSTARASN